MVQAPHQTGSPVAAAKPTPMIVSGVLVMKPMSPNIWFMTTTTLLTPIAASTRSCGSLAMR